MRLIDADALIKTLNDNGVPYNADVNYFVENAPTIDAVEVVRCKECRWRNTKRCIINFFAEDLTDDKFCSWGERKDNE